METKRNSGGLLDLVWYNAKYPQVSPFVLYRSAVLSRMSNDKAYWAWFYDVEPSGLEDGVSVSRPVHGSNAVLIPAMSEQPAIQRPSARPLGRPVQPATESDEEIRHGRWFRSEAPTPNDLGHRIDRPGPDIVPVDVPWEYGLTFPKGQHRQVWCAYCQCNTHSNGAAVRFSDGTLRSAGSTCCKRLGDHEELLDRFKAKNGTRRKRARLLNNFERVGRVLPELHEELIEHMRAPSVSIFSTLRSRWLAEFGPLHEWLVRRGDELKWIERHTSYAGSSTQKETDDNDYGKTKGSKVVTEERTYRIRGASWLHVAKSPEESLKRLIARVYELKAFFSSKTQGISDAEIHGRIASARRLVQDCGDLEALSMAPLEFFAPGNLSKIVEVRNLGLAESSYTYQPPHLIRRDGIEEWRLIFPSVYKPITVRGKSRIEFAVK